MSKVFTKKCIKCQKSKASYSFYTNNKKADKKNDYCKLCGKEISKEKDRMRGFEYRKNKIEKMIESELELLKEKNREKAREKRKTPEYKEKKKKSQALYIKKRIKKDPIYKLKNTLKSNIRRCFQTKKLSKTSKTEKIIGCSYSLFFKWMNFTKSRIEIQDNVKVNIDHFFPICLAKTEDDCFLLNHFSNLRLISQKDNFKKHSSLPTKEDIVFHQSMLNDFLIENKEENDVFERIKEKFSVQ